MNTSKFKFSTPTIQDIHFKKSVTHMPNSNKFKYNIKNSIKIQRSDSDDFAKEYLTLNIGNADEECPFELEITISAQFKWHPSLADAQIDSLLSINAPALLLSYLRPMISLILNQAGFPNFNIPFADFTGKLSE